MDPAEYAALAGGTLALFGLAGVGWRFIRALYGASRRLERIDRLARELAPNSGGTIKDTVHRLETTLDNRLTGLHAKVSDLEGKVDGKLEEYGTRLARAEGRIEAIAMVTSPTMLIEDDEGRIREARDQGRPS